MEIAKVPTSQRDRERSGPFKRPRPKPDVVTKPPAPADHPAPTSKDERRLDVTA